MEAEFKQSLAKLQPESTPLQAAVQSPQGGQAAEDTVVVEITSEPSGAEIYVDGVFSSSTPSKIQVPPGEHVFKVTRSGYKDLERKVSVEAGSAKTLHAILEGKESQEYLSSSRTINFI